MILSTPSVGLVPSLISFVKQELKEYPGRYNAMLRYLLSSVIVITISLALSVPQLSYSLLVVFFATQKNIILTRVIFPLFLLVNTVAVASAILILKFTIDIPPLRLLCVGILLLFLLYKMRSSKKWSFLFFSVAITITYSQSFVDLTSDAELLVRNSLWSWVAGCYATVVAHIVNSLFLPVEPVKQLKDESRKILAAISHRLHLISIGKEVEELGINEIQSSVLSLHSYLKFSIMRSEKFRNDQAKHLNEIAAIERLYSVSRELYDLNKKEKSQDIKYNCLKLSKECHYFYNAINEDACYKMQVDDKININELPECLQEMYSALLSVSLFELHEQSVKQATNQGEIVTAKKNELSYDYIKYGIKTLLSVSLCYVFFTAVQWPGIHTSMLTCIIVAVPGLGASIQKSLLRIVGCVVGSLLALLCTVFILPYIDSITGLLLMVVPVIALSGWVAAGSEKSSYAGIQILFAFSLATFATFYPHPDLSEIRDRFVGIMLGITVSTIVHSLLWPETEGKTLRKSVAGLFFDIAERMKHLKPSQNLQAEGWLKIDATQNLLTRVALEPNWRGNDNEQLDLDFQSLLGKVRELHVALYRLEMEYALTLKNIQQKEFAESVSNCINALSVKIRSYGEGLLSEPATTSPVNTDDIIIDIQDSELGGNQPLLHRARNVISLCHMLPSWPSTSNIITVRGNISER